MAMGAAKRLTRLLSDILDLSRVEAGKMTIHEAEFAVQELGDSVFDLFKVAARDKGVHLECLIDPDIPPRLVGDEARVRQILFNLAGNALKFTNKGGITVKIAPLPSQKPDECPILFSVSDTGIGIPEDNLDKLFQPFIQVDGTYARSHQGAGLGLAIVKRLVDLLGGNVSVLSTVGEGTTVNVVLPFTLIAGKSSPEQRETDQFREASRKLRILLAEDDPSNALPTRKLLEKSGHEVTLAEHGQHVLDLLAAHDFDVILMDVQMPVMDGVEATKRIRSQESEVRGQEPESRDISSELQPSTFNLQRPRRIPIIALTAYAMTGDREKFLESGMDDYLAKPVKMVDLERVLEKILVERNSNL
jgi:CheY-like chemotaxis protein